MPVDGGEPRACQHRRGGHLDQLDPVAEQQGHRAPGRDAGAAEQAAGPGRPVDQLAPGAPLREVVERGGVGSVGGQVEQRHARIMTAEARRAAAGGGRRGAPAAEDAGRSGGEHGALRCRHGRRRTRDEGGRRRAARQRRHRRRQVRRLPHHRLGLDAGRERPLGRRLGQPGAAAARRPARRRRRPPPTTRSATAASATSGRSSWRSSCSAWAACSPSTRASRRSATRTSSSRSRSPSSSSWWRSCSRRSRSAPRSSSRRKVKDPQVSWWTFIRRSKNPELPVVLLEDLGALVGLVIALTAVTVAHVTGDAGVGRRRHAGHRPAAHRRSRSILAIEMKGLLIGESASTADQQKIVAAIEVEPSVQRLIHMRTEHIGPEELLVGAKIELIPDLSVGEAAEAVNRIEASVRRAVPDRPRHVPRARHLPHQRPQPARRPGPLRGRGARDAADGRRRTGPQRPRRRQGPVRAARARHPRAAQAGRDVAARPRGPHRRVEPLPVAARAGPAPAVGAGAQGHRRRAQHVGRGADGAGGAAGRARRRRGPRRRSRTRCRPTRTSPTSRRRRCWPSTAATSRANDPT